MPVCPRRLPTSAVTLYWTSLPKRQGVSQEWENEIFFGQKKPCLARRQWHMASSGRQDALILGNINDARMPSHPQAVESFQQQRTDILSEASPEQPLTHFDVLLLIETRES